MPEKAVRREIKEEYCADVINLKFLGANNILRQRKYEKTHWIALLFAAQIKPEQVRIGEPEKMDEVGWFTPKTWPKPLHSMFLKHFEFVLQFG
jgi:ADP-ribose pyrophosphatase YjhB (NUDIX family)